MSLARTCHRKRVGVGSLPNATVAERQGLHAKPLGADEAMREHGRYVSAPGKPTKPAMGPGDWL